MTPRDLSCLTLNTRTCKCLMSRQLADELLMPCKCYSTYITVQFMYVHVTHTLGGAMSRAFSLIARSYVDVPNKLFKWLYSRVLRRPGLIPGRDDLGQLSLHNIGRFSGFFTASTIFHPPTDTSTCCDTCCGAAVIASGDALYDPEDGMVY